MSEYNVPHDFVGQGHSNVCMCGEIRTSLVHDPHRRAPVSALSDPMYRARFRIALHLLPDPGPEVVGDCLNFIDEQADTITALRSEVERQAATIVELRAALAPFAAIGDPGPILSDDCRVGPKRGATITLGDVRRAAALLGDEEEGTDGSD